LLLFLWHLRKINKQFATLDPKTANLRLLWIACGTEDGLICPDGVAAQAFNPITNSAANQIKPGE
jgi:hypothetical protein